MTGYDGGIVFSTVAAATSARAKDFFGCVFVETGSLTTTTTEICAVEEGSTGEESSYCQSKAMVGLTVMEAYKTAMKRELENRKREVIETLGRNLSFLI